MHAQMQFGNDTWKPLPSASNCPVKVAMVLCIYSDQLTLCSDYIRAADIEACHVAPTVVIYPYAATKQISAQPNLSAVRYWECQSMRSGSFNQMVAP